jgi:2-iminobutanoate/2-iminopropanoate deaminase
MMHHKHAIETGSAPAAIGPYSQAIKTGNLLFISGQLPLDPATGDFPPGDAAAQTHRCLENVTAILEAAGGVLTDVVQTTVYLQRMADFPEINRVYAEFFSPPEPARATVEVAALPKGALVEIAAVAALTA